MASYSSREVEGVLGLEMRNVSFMVNHEWKWKNTCGRKRRRKAQRLYLKKFCGCTWDWGRFRLSRFFKIWLIRFFLSLFLKAELIELQSTYRLNITEKCKENEPCSNTTAGSQMRGLRQYRRGSPSGVTAFSVTALRICQPLQQWWIPLTVQGKRSCQRWRLVSIYLYITLLSGIILIIITLDDYY